MTDTLQKRMAVAVEIVAATMVKDRISPELSFDQHISHIEEYDSLPLRNVKLVLPGPFSSSFRSTTQAFERESISSDERVPKSFHGRHCLTDLCT